MQDELEKQAPFVLRRCTKRKMTVQNESVALGPRQQEPNTVSVQHATVLFDVHACSLLPLNIHGCVCSSECMQISMNESDAKLHIKKHNNAMATPLSWPGSWQQRAGRQLHSN